MGLVRRFGTKVHIARWRMNAYQDLPAVAACLTVDGESTRIHACSFRVRRCFEGGGGCSGGGGVLREEGGGAQEGGVLGEGASVFCE